MRKYLSVVSILCLLGVPACGGGTTPATDANVPGDGGSDAGRDAAPMADVGTDAFVGIDAGHDGGMSATAPTVVSVTPLAGAVNVPVATTVTATFSQAMAAGTITAGGITLADDTGAAVTGTVALDAAGTLATFTPGAALDPARIYTATIPTSVTDTTGRALAMAYTWRFAPGVFAAVAGPGDLSFDQIVTRDAMDVTQNSQYLPDHTNVWDLDQDFGLDDGGDDQADGALEIHNVTVAGMMGVDFPSDQTAAELTWLGPAFGAADGLVTAAAMASDMAGYNVIAGMYEARLANLRGASISQAIDLSTATGTVTLSFNATTSNCGNYITDPTTRGVTVDVLDMAGAVLTTTTAHGGAQTVDLTPYVGRHVTLRFTSIPGLSAWCTPQNAVDSVSVLDGAMMEHVTNGDFETGDLSGWTLSAPSEVREMRAGVRMVQGLGVTRTFYSTPRSAWARWVDVYENPSAAAIDATVEYFTNLGSDNCGVIYEADAMHRSLVTWDGGYHDDRDFGLVFGTNDRLEYTSNTMTPDGMGNCDGSELIRAHYSLHVPAGGRAVIVTFAVMNGENTWRTATMTSEHATAMDTAVADILANFRTDPQYRRGMSDAEIAAIVNW
jgi:hypothetical protein